MTDRQSATSPSRHAKPGHPRAFHLRAIVAGAALALVATVGVSVQAGGTGTAPTPAELASNYIAAIGTANAALVKAEAQLKALPMGATSAQVEASVAQLGPALKPLEALLAAKTPGSVPSQQTTTTATLPPTTLASLGAPSIYEISEGIPSVPAAPTVVYVGKTWAPISYGLIKVGYSSAPPAPLNIDGHTYAQGGQFEWTAGNDYGQVGAYRWNIPASKTFTAEVGQELSRLPADVALSFSGNGKPLSFVANGETVTSLHIPAKSHPAVAVTVPLAGITKLTVVLTVNPSASASMDNYTVDFGNAVFTH
jgi:hypothetical protein